MVDQPTFLSGKLLLAMPGMADPRFERAVIAMCVHDENGAVGVGVGHKRAGITFRTLLRQLDIEPGEAPDCAVHHGGPVEPGRGFVLHSTDWGGQDTLQVNGETGELFAMTGTIDVLRAIAEGRGPKEWIVALGYAGWGEGQLDGMAGSPPERTRRYCSRRRPMNVGRLHSMPKASTRGYWRVKPARPEIDI
jgi:putative transcriptional regulator